MKISKKIYILMLIALTFIISCDNDDELYPQLGDDPRNISEIIEETPSLSTLSSALIQAGLEPTLRTTTTYTVFAPENDAFNGLDLASLSEAELENVLLNHVLSTVTADFTSTMSTGYLTSLATGPDGNNLSFYTNADSELRFNGIASLVDGLYDLGATNGVMHTLDGVLTPPTVLDHALANPDYSSFAAAIEAADLNEFISEDGPFTVFAPNNSAFETFMTQLNGAFGWSTLADIPQDILQEVIGYHLISGSNMLDGDFDGSDQITFQGEGFTLNTEFIDDASYTNAGIVLTNIQGVNGVVHGVDKVLLPNSVFQDVLSATLNIVERCNDRGFTSFVNAVEIAGLTSSLSTDDLTAFVPNNDAFVALFAVSESFSDLADFDTPEEITALTDLLNYHLYSGQLLASDLTDGSSITTINGDAFLVDLTGDDPKLVPSFEEAIPSLIVNANIGATNGIIHEINRVMIPDALVSALGIPTASGGICPVGDPALVFFDWDANGPWWGNVVAENDASHSLDGSSYGRANFQTGGTGWQDLFWRNGSTMNGQDVVGSNINDYSLKFDLKTIEPLTAGMFRIRFRDADGVDAFYNWQPWNDAGEAFETDGWETMEIPLAVLGVPDFSLVDAEFGMAFEGADVLLNFTIDNVRFDTPGCGGPDPVDDTSLVFFDWDANGPWWGNVVAENDAAISLDGSNYGRANFQTGGTGWQDLFWRNGSTMNGQNVVGSNVNDYVLKFDLYTIEPLSAGMFRIRFNDADGVDAFYDWQPWNDTGEPLDTEESWITITIPCSVLGVPDFSLVDAEFGMAFEGADVLLNFAMDNVRFEAL